MSILDDSTIFAAIVQQGGFSHAAKYLGLSNGLISRRISNLEKKLGVTLIKRTTRQLYLTPEGEVFWQHAKRIQQELTAALSVISASAKKPKGMIRISAPSYFGKQYLTSIIMKFLTNFSDIDINLILTGETLDPIKENLDLIIRGAGYLNVAELKDSSMRAKILLKEKVGLYASPDYILNNGEPNKPQDLINHAIINYVTTNSMKNELELKYRYKDKNNSIILPTKFSSNDIESNLIACISGHAIGRFTDLNVKTALQQKQLKPILTEYDWGDYHLFAIYSKQLALPRRTRLLLDFIIAHCN